MIHRCLYCRTSFKKNETFHAIPRGRRIAFDPELGRLWVVCGKCFRWNLQPVEERDAALYELEKAAHDTGVVVAHTANITLLHAGRTLLIRVGAARLPERAWWRYGRELRKRRAAFDSATSRVTAYTFGALQRMADLVGMGDPDTPIHWDDDPVADIIRWRRFGWAAWHGRESCPYCRSTLRALTYELSWWVYPLQDAEGRLELGVPCPRCDPWTPDNVYRIRGRSAETALRRVLAYQNVTGASEGLIQHASQALEEAGTLESYTRAAVARRESLWKMGTAGAIALEIAVNETAESRLLQSDVRDVEFMWRQEEALARIMDEELTPLAVLEAHLRKLPIRLRRDRKVPRILVEAGDL
ncbi:MAG TPA: hypothetical protein VK858_01700 [Longimicrobiales bacterium]|nr:hypothetical protein [Longimicrobiales bacterium]